MRPRRYRLYNFASLLVFFAILAFGWAHAQSIEDWIKLRGYSPPASVATLASEDTMTAKASHIFYVNRPKLTSDVSAFRTDCPETEQTIVLGCYHPGQNGINVYAVQDSRLHGVQEVTAAHEMLHAAYERLSIKEREQIDGWLEDYYKNDLHDQRLIDTINAYKKTEPNDVVNEMHSVFGTEIGNLPTNLENYYQRYFTNRAAVVGFAAGYENEFTTRIAEINADDSKLADLKSRIAAEESSLSAQLNQIDSDRARLDSYKAQGQYSQYNAAVSGFNAEIDAYNAGVTQLQSDIAYYNQLVDERNSLAGELRSLDKSLDTRLTTQTR